MGTFINGNMPTMNPWIAPEEPDGGKVSCIPLTRGNVPVYSGKLIYLERVQCWRTEVEMIRIGGTNMTVTVGDALAPPCCFG